MPSPKSREEGFYYSHPQNKFWRVLSAVFEQKTPETKIEKLDFLHLNHIALWDVLESCFIKGASDASIMNPKVNDIKIITNRADIKCVFTTGTKAARLYRRYCMQDVGIETINLPSTSPANCRITVKQLIEKYKIILTYI